LLAPIAEAIAEFVCSADFRYVKACPGQNCVLVFLDQNPATWKAMVQHGCLRNRAKQDAHLARRKKTDALNKAPPLDSILHFK